MNASSEPASSAWSRYAALTRHAFQMEFRQKNGLAGLILFSIAAVYTCYQVAGSRAEAEAWNALAWVVLLFSAFNAVAKSWPEDAPEMRAYLIHVVRPQEWVLARITFFSLLLCGMSSIVFIAFTLFLGTEHLNGMQAVYFFIGMLLTSVALGLTPRHDSSIGRAGEWRFWIDRGSRVASDHSGHLDCNALWHGYPARNILCGHRAQLAFFGNIKWRFWGIGLHPVPLSLERLKADGSQHLENWRFYPDCLCLGSRIRGPHGPGIVGAPRYWRYRHVQ